MAEPVWISSSGAGVTVMEEQPLFYSWNQDNDNKLCLSTEHTEPYVRDSFKSPVCNINFFQATRDEVIHLNYELWVKDNAKDMFQYMAGKVWSLPDSLSIPDERMFTFPVWSTWAQYKTHINESVIIGFAR